MEGGDCHVAKQREPEDAAGALLAMTERKLQQRAFLTDKKTGINSSYLPAGDPGYRSRSDLAHEKRSCIPSLRSGQALA